MKTQSILFLTTLVLSLTSCENKTSENNQTDTSASQQQPKELSNKERDFIMETANDNMLEVQLGKLAHQKAASQKVKDFGHHMMMDHEQSNNKLKQLASENNITLPDSVEEGKNKKEDLAKLSGKEFDKKYISEMVKDHKKNVGKFEEMSEKAEDPAIKSFAQENLPTLKAHYMEAQKLDSMMNTSGNKKKSGNKMSLK